VGLVLGFLFALSALGILSLIVAAFVKHSFSEALTVLVSGLFLAGAATLSGAIVGFLFGVPQQQRLPRDPATSVVSNGYVYRPNTNLDQISDWLSKMIVGIGLTQIPSIIDFFQKIGGQCGPAFGNSPSGEIIATSIVIHYLLVGFFLGFLTAYLWLPGAFYRANVRRPDAVDSTPSPEGGGIS
jgi:hypothetical protein